MTSTLVLVSGCGPGAAQTEPARTAAEESTVSDDSELTVTVRADAGKAEQTFRLRCDPPAGDHPDPVAACAALGQGVDALRPVPKDQGCTDIYGGPQTARVQGRWRGEPVDASFSRTNGCEIARWDALAPLFGDATGSRGRGGI